MTTNRAHLIAVLALSSAATSATAKPGVGQPSHYKDLQPVVAVTYSGALGLSASGGVIKGSRFVCTGMLDGLLIQAQAGTGGGRLSMGVASAYGGLLPEVALGAKVFALRTWSSSSSLPERQTYGGLELAVSVY